METCLEHTENGADRLLAVVFDMASYYGEKKLGGMVGILVERIQQQRSQRTRPLTGGVESADIDGPYRRRGRFVFSSPDRVDDCPVYGNAKRRTIWII